MYLSSNKIVMFPSSKRGTVNNMQFDLNSRYASEYNITTIINSLTDNKSFVISNDLDNQYNEQGEVIASILAFNVHGYYFQADILPILQANPSAQKVYACISIDSEGNLENILSNDSPTLMNWAEVSSVHLDTAENNSDPDSEDFSFKGVNFSSAAATGDNQYSLELLEKVGTEWVIPAKSKFRFSSKLIQAQDNSDDSLADIYTSSKVYRSSHSDEASTLKDGIKLVLVDSTDNFQSGTFSINNSPETYRLSLPPTLASGVFSINKNFKDLEAVFADYDKKIDENKNLIEDLTDRLVTLEQDAIRGNLNFVSTSSNLAVRSDSKTRSLYVAAESVLNSFTAAPSLSVSTLNFNINNLSQPIIVYTNKSSHIKKVKIDITSKSGTYMTVTSDAKTDTTNATVSYTVTIDPKIEVLNNLKYSDSVMVEISYYKETSSATPTEVQQLPLTLTFNNSADEYFYEGVITPLESGKLVLHKGTYSLETTLTFASFANPNLYNLSTASIKNIYLDSIDLLTTGDDDVEVTKLTASTPTFKIIFNRINKLSNYRNTKNSTLKIVLQCETKATGLKVEKELIKTFVNEPLYDITSATTISNNWYTDETCTSLASNPTVEAEGGSKTLYLKSIIDVKNQKNFNIYRDDYGLFVLSSDNYSSDSDIIRTSIEEISTFYESSSSSRLISKYKVKFSCYDEESTYVRSDKVKFRLTLSYEDGDGSGGTLGYETNPQIDIKIPAAYSGGGNNFD